MSDDNDTDRYSPREMTVTIAGEELPLSGVEWDGPDDQPDATHSEMRESLYQSLNGTLTFSGEVDEIEATVTVTDSEGNKHRIENATIKSREKVLEDARELRENAPKKHDLGDPTSDIDAVITALLEAKDRGVRKVYVDDDGRSRSPDPEITNNHVRYYGNGPEPDELEEWVDL